METQTPKQKKSVLTKTSKLHFTRDILTVSVHSGVVLVDVHLLSCVIPLLQQVDLPARCTTASYLYRYGTTI